MSAANSNDHADLKSRLGEGLPVAKMPAHWLMARLGKRVLRPGGLGATRWLLQAARIDREADVVELAPGLGVTAELVLARAPRSYVGVERDQDALRLATARLKRAGFGQARIIHGDAAAVPLAAGAATVVLGEAMLSMQTLAQKQAIIREAVRLLRPGGRYAIHELGIIADLQDHSLQETIQRDLSEVIHVGVRIGPVAQWTGWLAEAGLQVTASRTFPMKLLEPSRLIADEGLFRTLRFVFNALRTPGARRRLWAVRSALRRHSAHLCAVTLVALKPPEPGPDR